MKCFLKTVSVLLASCVTLSAVSMNDLSADAATTVMISPYNTYEINGGVFEGWGTSLCWWANRIGYSDSLSQQAADLFFGDKGLRMNIARFNIGGGDNPSHDHITRTDSNMPGYTVYNNGQVTYDWSADANQRNVLLKAIKSAGDDMHVEMYSNSPPYYMTKSGCSSGGTDAGKNNLKDDCYDDFANYLAEVSAHYKNEWGVEIDSIAPMNEPYTNFWGAYSNKQEGCHFDIGTSQTNIILELQKAMKAKGMGDVIISGTDETSIDTQISAFNALSADAKNAVARIDTHTYGGSKRTELKNLALSSGKNLWMSEVDGNGTAGTNAGQMSPALWLSERIMTDCNNLNSSAWILWQAIDKHICAAGYNGKKDSGMPDINTGFWGLAVADHDSDKIILTKKYYAFGQFSRYIRPGFIMLKSSNSTMAAYDKKNGQLVIVATNTSGSASDMYFDLSSFAGIGTSAEVIRTSGSMNNGENWKSVGNINTSKSGLSASLAPNSVTTFIIDGMKASSFDGEEITLTENMLSGSDAWNQTANDYKKVIDKSATTFFDGVENGWVQIDLGKSYDLSAIAFAPRAGYEYRCVDGKFSVSSDGSSWSELYTISATPPSGLSYATNLNNPEKVRYVRYQVPAGAPQNTANKDNVYCCNIAEIALYGHPSAIIGDVDGDGSLTSGDALLLKKYLLQGSALDEAQLGRADCDSNSRADIADLSIIERQLIK